MYCILVDNSFSQKTRIPLLHSWLWHYDDVHGQNAATAAAAAAAATAAADDDDEDKEGGKGRIMNNKKLAFKVVIFSSFQSSPK